MRIDQHIAVLRRDGAQLADVAQCAGRDATVPTCPGWQIRDLLRHLGGVHRWAACLVATGRAEPFTAAEGARFFAAVADDSLIAWFRDGHRALVDTLEVADQATASCWTFLPAPSPLAFWARRQAHETAIHRADAQSAIATVPGWDPDFAVDGIDELLNGFFARRPERITADPPVRITLCATDCDAAWTVAIDPAGHHVVAGADAATLNLTGLACELYLLLWNRLGVDRVDAQGDLHVWDRWSAQAQVTWS